ncbi:MAG: thioredoxin domain-containing protein [Candidatus Omnitrophica bacterium]|nr:thioredoxin domain-containing protein [Candidatus Omnitrophota bacterium]
MAIKRILSLSFFAVLILCSFSDTGNTTEERACPPQGYTLISSDDMSHVNDMLRSSIKSLIPGCNETFAHYESPQARQYIDELSISFIPYVIFDPSIIYSGSFFHMARNNMIEMIKGHYVIPAGQLRMGDIMILKRPKKQNTLRIYAAGLCRDSSQAMLEILDLVKRKNLDIDVEIKYIVNSDEFGMTSRRGPDEIREDIRQIAIKKYYPDKFFDYISIRQDHSPAQALEGAGIQSEDIDSKRDEALNILKDSQPEIRSLGISASPVFLWENIYLITNISGLKRYAPFNAKAHQQVSGANVAAGPVPIDFFYSYRCAHCAKIKRQFLAEIEKKYEGKIKINYRNISDQDELLLMYSMEKEYGVLGKDIPELFLPNKVLWGEIMITRELERAIDELLAAGSYKPAKRVEADKNAAQSRFSGFSLLLVGLAGLLDGINPCAFTALVFFIGFLSFHSYSRRDIFYAGSSFLLAVFITYLLLGMGGAAVLGSIDKFYIFSNIIKYGIACFTLALGLLALYDYIVYKKTARTEGLKLQLPAGIKNFIQMNISKTYRSGQGPSRPWRAVCIAFISGAVISVLESVCTGQVYLPVIALIIKDPVLRIKAFGYLVWYNLAFILPLVIIFALAVIGVSSGVFESLVKRHLAGLKLAYTVLFFGLAVFLFFS